MGLVREGSFLGGRREVRFACAWWLIGFRGRWFRGAWCGDDAVAGCGVGWVRLGKAEEGWWGQAWVRLANGTETI